MTSRCAFGCGGSGDLGQNVISTVLGSQKGLAIDESLGPRDSVAPLPTQRIWSSLPQRLHKVCVLLWRLPKDEVPFAVWMSIAALLGLCWVLVTHSSWARMSVTSSQS